MLKKLYKYVKWLVTKTEYKSEYMKKRNIEPHHDSQPYSHYQISQQALRDARKY